MKLRHILILSLLTLLWGWHSFFLLVRGGVNLKNILIAGAAGWMIIYPVLRRFRAADKNHEKNG